MPHADSVQGVRFRRIGDLAAATQVERRELLAPRGHRHHRHVGDVTAVKQVDMSVVSCLHPEATATTAA